MARLGFGGFEGNDVTLEGLVTIPSFITSSPVPRSGSFAGRCASISTFAFTGVNGRSYFARTYWNQTATGLDHPILTFRNSATDLVYAQYLASSGTIRLFNAVGSAQIGSASAALGQNQWYRIELKITIGTGAVDAAELLIDGVSIASTSGASISDLVPNTLALGTDTTAALDDWALNDDQGSNQNSYPGSGGIVLLVPISDNARAALWTGGVGGTTNLFDAVNNEPPIGTATETDLTQIEHAGGAAGSTDAYDANMTTYTTAGIGASDTINVLQLLAAHGEDIATGTKLLAFSVVSNPAIATSGNVNAGDNVGALGTWPSNWAVHRGTVTYTPSVTVGTSPVMRALRPETANRVASVCFMGMLVDYTPAVATLSPPPFQRRWVRWPRRRF